MTKKNKELAFDELDQVSGGFDYKTKKNKKGDKYEVSFKNLNKKQRDHLNHLITTNKLLGELDSMDD